MDFISATDNVLFVWDASANDKVESVVNQIKEKTAGKAPSIENLERLKLGEYPIDFVLSTVNNSRF